MDKSDVKLELAQLERAYKRFEEVLKRDPLKDDIAIDASIQRFEFTYELGWKTLRRFLSLEGVIAATPKEVLQEAFRLGWLIEGDAFWSQIIKDRNMTSDTYDQKIALSVYQRVKTYAPAFGRLIDLLKKK
jgi:nucleotidyltransferase substrate binding protein (TIGR01987 family)